MLAVSFLCVMLDKFGSYLTFLSIFFYLQGNYSCQAIPLKHSFGARIYSWKHIVVFA